MAEQPMHFRSLEEASHSIFDLLSDFVGINTFFIAKNDGYQVDILEVLNKDYTLLESGFQIEFQQSY
ncbi:hypothetical protein [Aquibacillus salsiterrae]|uniref:Uncharacterized protein n=1 Tax=Aquibacillus salsiterrae TaxID=2950439 RepID=A0A9X4AFT2_9BACI|nr:hypothetical protein [Aquibacillus salsiterrae]MDC3418241.1 hypothetical protein [Aquibacillus salsiterrae]